VIVATIPDFEDWYRTQHPRLLSAMTLLAGSLDEAAEATDEALARAMLRWDTVGAMVSPGGWVYRVALNVLRRRARRAAIERRRLHAQPPVAPIALPEAHEEIWAAVRDLPSRQRAAIVLRYVADLTESEIAKATGVSRSTVSATLIAARRRLETQLRLEPQEVDGG